MAVARIKEYRGQGETRFFGTTGANYVGHRASAAVTTQYTLTYPAAPPVGNQVMQITPAGVISFINGGGGTLDTAYDFGGAGAGRIITADAGPFEVAGAGGIQVTHTDPLILFETTGVGDYNWRIVATTDNTLRFDRGDQDADVSDDTFDPVFVIEGVNRRVGINEIAPASELHVTSLSGSCRVDIEAAAAADASMKFAQGATNRFRLGYDNSVAGFVIGRETFSNPVLFIEDITGDVGIGELVPDAKLHVDDSAALVTLIESSGTECRLGLRASGTTDENSVYLLAKDDKLNFGSGSATRAVFNSSGNFGINTTLPVARLDVFETSLKCVRFNRGAGVGTAFEFLNSGSGTGMFLDQGGNGVALQIDSEATSKPLVNLLPLTANTRGDIAFGTARTADPSSPSEGDVWYDGTLSRFKVKTSLGVGRTAVSQYGPNFGEGTESVTIATGVVTIAAGIVVLTAEGGGPTDTLDTINSNPQAQHGDTIILRPVSGDAITLGNGTGNMKLNGSSVLLNSINDNCYLFYNGTNWVEISRVLSAVA